MSNHFHVVMPVRTHHPLIYEMTDELDDDILKNNKNTIKCDICGMEITIDDEKVYENFDFNIHNDNHLVKLYKNNKPIRMCELCFTTLKIETRRTIKKLMEGRF